MKTNLYLRVSQRLMQLSFLLAITLLAGCELFNEEEEEPECEGDVVLISRRHDTIGSNVTISNPSRNCYAYSLVEQRNLYMNMGTELDVSNIYIELAGEHHFHTITLSSQGEYFFEADPQNITASFSRLDANKIPLAGDKYVTDFEMLTIDPETREISFIIRESQFWINNNTKFVFEPYEMINLVVPENP